MAPRVPWWMAQNANEQGDLTSFMSDAGYPLGDIQPQMQRAPDGPFGLSGEGLDSAALATLQALQNAPRPRGFAQNALAGFASGLAGGRARQAMQRTKANEAATEGAVDLDKERRKAAASYLATYRHDQRRAAAEAAKPQAAPKVERRFPLTPRLREQLKANNIFVPDEATDIPESVAFRDKPAGNPALDEIRAANLKQQQDAEAARIAGVESTANGIADFSLDPTRVPRDRNFRDVENLANQKLREKGSPYTLQQLQALKANADKFMANENGARFIALRTSIPTFADHLGDFERFNADFDKAYKRLPWWQANMGIMGAAKAGYLGDKAAFAAAQLESNRPIVAKELSMLLAYPYAPFKESDEKADQIISNFWSPKQQKGALGAVKSIVRSRIKNVMAQVAYAGGKDNPYLLPPSGIEAFGETFPQKPNAKGPGKTLAEQYQNGGR